jgi:hypothetical protein
MNTKLFVTFTGKNVKFIINLDKCYPNKPFILTTPNKKYNHTFSLKYKKYLSLLPKEPPYLIIWIHSFDETHSIWRRTNRKIIKLTELTTPKEVTFIKENAKIVLKIDKPISFDTVYSKLSELKQNEYNKNIKRKVKEMIENQFDTSEVPPVGLFYHLNCAGEKKTLLSPMLVDETHVKSNEDFWLNIYNQLLRQYDELGMEINEQYIWAEMVMNVLNKTISYYPDTRMGKHIEPFWKKVADCEDFALGYLICLKVFESIGNKTNKLFKKWAKIMKQYIPFIATCTNPSESNVVIKGHSFDFLIPMHYFKDRMTIYKEIHKDIWLFFPKEINKELEVLMIDPTEFVYYRTEMKMTKKFNAQSIVYKKLRTGLLNIRTFYTIDDTSFYKKLLMLHTPYFYYNFIDELITGKIHSLPFGFFCSTIDSLKNKFGGQVKDVFYMKDTIAFSPQYFIDKQFIRLSEIESKFKISVPCFRANGTVFEKPYEGDPFYNEKEFETVSSLFTISGKHLNKKKCVGYGWVIPGELVNVKLMNCFREFIKTYSFEYEKQQFGYDSFSYFVKFFLK